MNLPTTKPNDIDYARLMREWELLDDRNKVLECENAALKIKCNKLRLALEDIEEASVDPWAKIAADRVLKEVQP